MRQGRGQLGSVPPIGPLPLVAQQTCAHAAYIPRLKSLMNCPNNPPQQPREDKAPAVSENEQLRRELLAMIRRNEDKRRRKPK